MKKLTVILVALVAVLAVSCKKSSPAETAIKMFNDYAEKVSKAQSMEDVQKIGEQMQKEFADFEAKGTKV